MKLKKKYKKFIIIIVVLLLLGLLGFILYQNMFGSTPPVKEVKVISKIDKYGYNLKDNKTDEYKKMFKELEKILNEDEVDEEKYVSKISEMFIYDFYSLDDKSAKTDIGGVDFVYPDILENFLQNAQDTFYKYVESNIYNNRIQDLPVVSEVEIGEISQGAIAYQDKTDEEGYTVEVSWDYIGSKFATYQKSATLKFIHDDVKLYLVELQ